MTQTGLVPVDICICTFRRPFLVETLRSVGDLDSTGLAIRVIVSDNDSVPSAQPMIELIGRTFPFPITYVHAPAANISVARNACLDAADAEFIAFVDDDEVVSRPWLRELLRQAKANDADVVLGPVKAVYDRNAPRWMSAGDFHSTAPVVVGGAIRTGYTCNALLRWSGQVREQRFDLELGRSGGEDTAFFYHLHDLGARIVEAPQATVYEPVPPSRARFRWLMQRRLRSGQTHGMIIRRSRRLPWIGAVGLAGAKVAYCLALTGATLFSPVRWRQNLLRAALHAGVISGLAGGRQPVLYGNAK